MLTMRKNVIPILRIRLLTFCLVEFTELWAGDVIWAIARQGIPGTIC
jgi:hypothetical protein